MKTTNNFGLQFITRKVKNSQNQGLIYVRVTVNGKRHEISLKRTVDLLYWDQREGCVKGNKELETLLNPCIDDVRHKLMDCYHQLQIQNKFITSAAIKSLFLGEEKRESTLCALMEFHHANMKTVLQYGTLKNYYTTTRYIQRFLKHRYRTDDVYLAELNYQFITEFEFFLRSTKPLNESNPLRHNGVMKHIERLRKMVTLAVKMEWIPKGPFIRYRLRFQKTERQFLTGEELAVIEQFSFSKEKLDRVRDLFVFSCYTGLSYIDLVSLSSSNICLGIDGEKWIKTFRQKTDTPVNVPLLPKALLILEKYAADPVTGNKHRLLPFMCNQKINEHLKEIAKSMWHSKAFMLSYCPPHICDHGDTQ